MRPVVAVSTSSCPRLGAVELAEAVLANGGEGVELRVGRGHEWEREGGLTVAAAGVAVTGIASSRALGAETAPEDEVDVGLAALIGTRLRCFLDPRCGDDREAARRAESQVTRVQRALGAADAVVVEPHPGYASLPGVAAFCAKTGAEAVIDTYALQLLGVEAGGAFSELGRATRVLHVKGFERGGERGWRHRPLRPEDLPDARALAHAPKLAALVLETKTPLPWPDLRVLRRWVEARSW